MKPDTLNFFLFLKHLGNSGGVRAAHSIFPRNRSDLFENDSTPPGLPFLSIFIAAYRARLNPLLPCSPRWGRLLRRAAYFSHPFTTAFPRSFGISRYRHLAVEDFHLGRGILVDRCLIHVPWTPAIAVGSSSSKRSALFLNFFILSKAIRW